MIRNTIRIGLGNKGREAGSDAVRRRLKMRPTLTELEGRELLSTFTASSAHHDGGAAAIGSARSAQTQEHVFRQGNSDRDHSELKRSHKPILKGHGRPTLRAPGPILSQTFNGTTQFPSGWQQFLSGSVAQSPENFLTMTDTSSNYTGVGISAMKSKTVPFTAVGVKTTITAVINSVSPPPKLGNAIVGILSAKGAELAAGIDGQGVVFVVAYDPNQNIPQTVVMAGTDTSTSGGPVTLTCSIDATGVTVAAGNLKSTLVPFSKLDNFSLKTAFAGGAIPAIVVAGQPGPGLQPGGSANFKSITVATAALSRKAPGHRPRQ
jgi:hypothetical protein